MKSTNLKLKPAKRKYVSTSVITALLKSKKCFITKNPSKVSIGAIKNKTYLSFMFLFNSSSFIKLLRKGG